MTTTKKDFWTSLFFCASDFRMTSCSITDFPASRRSDRPPSEGAGAPTEEEGAVLAERVPAHPSLTEQQLLDRGCHLCIACESTYSTALGLHVHIRRFHRVMRPFRCFVCRKTFGHQVHLEQHMYVHAQMKSLTEDQYDHTPIEAPPEHFQTL